MPFADPQAGLDGLIASLQGEQQTRMGYWIEVPLSTTMIRIDGASNTWVWNEDLRNHMAYMLIGRTMFLNFFLSIRTTLPTAQDTFYLQIPDQYELSPQSITGQHGGGNTMSSRAHAVRLHMSDGSGTLTDGLIENYSSATAAAGNQSALSAGYRYLRIYRTGGANFVAGTTGFWGQLFFEVARVGV